MLQAKSPRNLAAGVTYLAFGAFVLVQVRDYPMGTLDNMGTGYFPIAFAVALVGFGLASICLSLVRDGDPTQRMSARSVLGIIGSIALFGLLLPYVGLVAGLVLLVLLCAVASPAFRPGWAPMLGMLALVAASVLVFAVFLNIPMPLLGTWFVDV